MSERERERERERASERVSEFVSVSDWSCERVSYVVIVIFITTRKRKMEELLLAMPWKVNYADIIFPTSDFKSVVSVSSSLLRSAHFMRQPYYIGVYMNVVSHHTHCTRVYYSTGYRGTL